MADSTRNLAICAVLFYLTGVLSTCSSMKEDTSRNDAIFQQAIDQCIKLGGVPIFGRYYYNDNEPSLERCEK